MNCLAGSSSVSPLPAPGGNPDRRADGRAGHGHRAAGFAAFSPPCRRSKRHRTYCYPRLATHDLAVDAFADEVLHLQDGVLCDG
jgi:hypothetical protein